MSATAFHNMKNRWAAVAAQRGDSYVGRIGQSAQLQQVKIEALLQRALKPSDQFEHGLDYGCGPGRFLPLLSDYCEHIWAVDLLESSLDKARGTAPNVTALQVPYPVKLQIPPIDLLWSCLTLQHIVDDGVYFETLAELARLLRPGARVLILDNAVDHAPHVKPRGPDVIAASLKLKKHSAVLVTIDARPNDHWFIDGTL